MSPNLKLLYRSLLAAATLLTLTLTIDPQTAVAKPDTKIAKSNGGGGIFSDMAATDDGSDTLAPNTNRSLKAARKSIPTTNIPTRSGETNTSVKQSELSSKSKSRSTVTTEVNTDLDKSKLRLAKKSIETVNNPLTLEPKSKSRSVKKSSEIITKAGANESKDRDFNIDNISELRSLAEADTAETKPKAYKNKKPIEIATNLSNLESRQSDRKIEIEVKSPKSKKIAMRSPSPYGGTHLRLVRYAEDGTNDIGNPIYTLEAYVDGQLRQSIKAISGAAHTQNRDRHVGENAAPLPDGIYVVSNAIVPGSIAEVGRTFVAITPQFETRRTDLGIHLDPSYNQRNGRDGTAGCVGITNIPDRDAINAFIEKYQPRNLYVKISSSK